MLPADHLSQTTQRLPTRRNEPGSTPGTFFVAPDAQATCMQLLRYGPDVYEERQIGDVGELGTPCAIGCITWLDVRGLKDERTLQAVTRFFDIHPLAAADVVNAPQRPKTESYGNHLLMIAHMAQLRTGSAGEPELNMEQVGLVLGRGWVVTFQESAVDGDVLEPVRQRIRNGRGKIRHSPADYLAYALLDAVVDGYYPALEGLGIYLEELEIQTLERPVPQTGRQIHALKRTLLLLRRGIWPEREALSALMRDLDDDDDSQALVGPTTRVFLRDVYDHVVQVVDMIETYREFAASLMDVYLSSVNNRMNEVVKVLTIISTIFLPLSFIAGVYGMNFDPDASPWNMPELKWVYGYPFAIGLMVVVAAGMLLAFRYFGWIGRPSKWPRGERDG